MAFGVFHYVVWELGMGMGVCTGAGVVDFHRAGHRAPRVRAPRVRVRTVRGAPWATQACPPALAPSS